MPRGILLSLEERIKIDVLNEDGHSNREIARRLNRSAKVINNYLTDKENYGKNRFHGRPSVISVRDRNRILRIASNSTKTASAILLESQVNASVRTVQRVIKHSPTIKHKKLLRKPPLTEKHKLARLDFARNHMTWKEEWRRVIFSDEKKINLDGPDGFASYYHDLRKEEKYFSKRQMGGASLMVWAAIGYNGNSKICFLPTRVNSEKYIELLDEVIVEPGEDMAAENYIFQQDNAPIHTARIVKEFFSSRNIEVLQWPARSPDLNIIENVWGFLVRSVYKECKQYNTIEELKTAIKESWQNIPQHKIKKLYDTMENRIFNVIKQNGGPTEY